MSVDGICCWSATLESTNRLTARLNSVDGYKQKSSSICKHYLSEHNSVIPPFISEQFHVVTKGSNKFDCLIKEMLFIRKLKPSLNVQADSIRAKVFT